MTNLSISQASAVLQSGHTISNYADVFAAADKDHNGYLTKAEFESLGFNDNVFEAADLNKSGASKDTIGQYEFEALCNYINKHNNGTNQVDNLNNLANSNEADLSSKLKNTWNTLFKPKNNAAAADANNPSTLTAEETQALTDEATRLYTQNVQLPNNATAEERNEYSSGEQSFIRNFIQTHSSGAGLATALFRHGESLYGGLDSHGNNTHSATADQNAQNYANSLLGSSFDYAASNQHLSDYADDSFYKSSVIFGYSGLPVNESDSP